MPVQLPCTLCCLLPVPMAPSHWGPCWLFLPSVFCLPSATTELNFLKLDGSCHSPLRA